LWFYLFKLLLPLRLSPLYPVWSVDAAQPLWWAALVSWIVVAGLLVRARARISGRAWFALIFALLMLLPTLGFVPFGNLALTFVSDQYLYLPAIGVLWLIAGWADARRLRTGDTPHPAWRVVPGLVLLCFTGGAMAYTTVFKNPTSVWTYTLKRNPDSYVAHVALGREALKSPHPAAADSAATHFMRATEIEPDEHPPYLLLFEACKRLGRLDDAEATIERLAARPHTDDVCARLHGEAAALLLAAGRPDRAAAQFESAIALRPDHAMNYVGLAEIHRAASRFVESVNLLRRALERDPDHLAAMHLLARVLATARDPAARNGPESLRLAGRVCDLTQFADWRIVDTLAAAQAECGDFASAIGSIDQAAQLAAQAGNQAALPILARMRALYEQGRPLRETRTGAP
jgi:Flp pilus assembly protein TadD